ncbi:MAG: zinc ribbon domain-containing protein [Anaerolineales bacterium]|nr:zinc ribbon domain-containing protein [Chloroflexota bacterium]MBL6982001.1 zinc ribbon domain-containing protein [Anaerolineales bacterium]
MYCPYCGTENIKTARFCKKCGQLLEQESQPKPKKKTWKLFLVSFLLLVIIVASVFIYSDLISTESMQIPVFINQPQTEWVSWNVPVGATDQATRELIFEGVLANDFINPPTKGEKEKYLWSYSIEFLQVEGDWAVLSAAPKDKSSGELVDTEGIPLLGRKINNQWEIAHPQEDNFILWLPQIPNSLLTLETKTYLIMRYGGDE